MRGRLACGAVVAAAVGLSAWATAGPQERGRPAGAESKPEAKAPELPADLAELVDLHNRERAKAKLDPLAPEAKLIAAAERHAKDMASTNTMSHEGSDGSNPGTRIEAAGYRGRGAGENVAAGQETPAQAMAAWMDSPPHKKNILGEFGEIGVARATGSDHRIYWCVTFGRPWPRLDPAAAATELAEAINAARREAEKRPLAVDRALAEAAAAHARLLAGRDALPGDVEPEKLERPGMPKVKGPRRRSLAMSVTSGPPSAAEALQTLLESSDQKATLLGDERSVGVGYANTPEGRPYWVVLVAVP